MGYAAKLGSSSVFKITGLTLAGQTAFDSRNQITITNGIVNDYYLIAGTSRRDNLKYTTRIGFNSIVVKRDNATEYDGGGSDDPIICANVGIIKCTATRMVLQSNVWAYVVWHIDY